MPLQSQKRSETGLLLSPFLGWGNQDSERMSDLLKVPGLSICVPICMLCTPHILGLWPTYPIQGNDTGPLPRGSSRVVMPSSSFVCGTLLSTLATCKGFSDSCICCLSMYFLQSSSVEKRQGVEGSPVAPVSVPLAYLGSGPSLATGAMDSSDKLALPF